MTRQQTNQNSIKTVAVVLAAGQGSRMGSKTPKQFLTLKDKEVVYYALQVYEQSEKIAHIILVTGQESVSFCENEIVKKYGLKKVSKVVAGGAERYHSVYEGVKAAEMFSPDLIMIHDGARPFVSESMIEESIAVASEVGGCTVGVPVKDTIKIVDENNYGIETPDRKKLYQVQTPQTFQYDLLKASYEKMFENENHKITDDTMLVELYGGVRCKVVFGAYENIKLTTPEDLIIAEKFVEKFFEKN